MAATIVIGSISIAANGIDFTATISGGSGSGYTPASGVTHIVFHNTTDAILFHTATTTISGATLSGTLAGYTPGSRTVTCDIAISSNISDSGGNSAQGQSGVAVTNNSTKTGTLWPKDFAGLGTILQGPPGGVPGEGCLYVMGTTTGTDCNILVNDWTSNGRIYVSVDGGAEVSTGVVSSGTVEQLCFPVYSGLSNATHTWTARWDDFTLTIADSMAQTTSATPPTIPATFGQSYGLNGPVYFNADRVPTIDGGSLCGYSGYQVSLFPSLLLRMNATITSLAFVAQNISTPGSMKRFRGILLRRAVGSTGQWYQVGLVDHSDDTNDNKLTAYITGLDGSKEWQYGLSMTGATGTFWVNGIAVTSPAATYNGGTLFTGQSVNTVAIDALPFVAAFGDSECSGFRLANWDDSWMFKLQMVMGYAIYSFANPGANSAALASAAETFSSLFSTAPIGCINYGMTINNSINETSPNPTAIAAFQSDCVSILNSQHSAFPSMWQITTGIAPDKSNATHPATDGAWINAIALAGNHSSFITQGWIVNQSFDPVNPYWGDHLPPDMDFTEVHLSPNGSTKTALCLARPVLAALDTPDVTTVTGSPVTVVFNIYK